MRSQGANVLKISVHRVKKTYQLVPVEQNAHVNNRTRGDNDEVTETFRRKRVILDCNSVVDEE